MAKELACPSCGNKHPLELLVGLDSFLCKQCGRKLAVPVEAVQAIKKVAPKESPAIKPEIVLVKSAEDNLSSTSLQDCDVVVVAKSSIPATGFVDLASNSPQTEVNSNLSVENADRIKKENEIPAKNPDSPSMTSKFLNRLTPKMPGLPIPMVGRIAAWLFGVPLGFVLVVLLPRFFGYGFHASDFLGVITNQGIGRYKVVVALVFLWSIASVVCVGICSVFLRKLFFAKKLAV